MNSPLDYSKYSNEAFTALVSQIALARVIGQDTLRETNNFAKQKVQ